ncbi:hypothetical protein BDZ45DRAFT_680088 [Acephala macrosclerotiorum]|nr:hypothetical protein BDZ45DRAFT_680088 [Acephala macrosclerotiorum]
MRFIELIICDIHGNIIHVHSLCPNIGDPLTCADAIHLQRPQSPGQYAVQYIDSGIATGLPIPALPLAILSTYLTLSFNRLITVTNSDIYTTQRAIQELELRILPILNLRKRLASRSKEYWLAQMPMREKLLEMFQRLELVRQQQSLLLQRIYQVLEKLKLVLQKLKLGRQMVITMLSVSMQRIIAPGADHK